jgi:hypothetical protein
MREYIKNRQNANNNGSGHHRRKLLFVVKRQTGVLILRILNRCGCTPTAIPAVCRRRPKPQSRENWPTFPHWRPVSDLRVAERRPPHGCESTADASISHARPSGARRPGRLSLSGPGLRQHCLRTAQAVWPAQPGTVQVLRTAIRSRGPKVNPNMM